MKFPSEAELHYPSTQYPDIAILLKAWHAAKFPYAKVRLKHAIDYLETVHDEEQSRLPDGPGCRVSFVDSFDTVAGSPGAKGGPPSEDPL